MQHLKQKTKNTTEDYCEKTTAVSHVVVSTDHDVYMTKSEFTEKLKIAIVNIFFPTTF